MIYSKTCFSSNSKEGHIDERRRIKYKKEMNRITSRQNRGKGGILQNSGLKTQEGGFHWNNYFENLSCFYPKIS